MGLDVGHTANTRHGFARQAEIASMPVLGGQDEATGGTAANVMDYGAVGDGVVNDTAAIQAAINSFGTYGGPTYLPAGVYKSGPLVMKHGTYLFGSSMSTQDGVGGYVPITKIDATGLTAGQACINGPGNASSIRVENLSLFGPTGANTTYGLSPGAFANHPRLTNVYINGFNWAFALYYTKQALLTGCHSGNAKTTGLLVEGSFGLMSVNGLYQNAGVQNYHFAAGAAQCTIFDNIVDELSGTGSSIYVESGTEINLQPRLVYIGSNSSIGVRFGAAAVRCTLQGTRVQPFAGNPTNTIAVNAGATDTRLIDISTNPAAGGDIADSGTRTYYLNVNGMNKFPAAHKHHFDGGTALANQSVTGSRGANAALADLLTKLANLGLITDSTS